MRINELTKGDRVRLLNFGDCKPDYRNRLLALGLIPGAEVLIVRVAPLGCPIQLEVRHTALTIRVHEAEALLWERL